MPFRPMMSAKQKSEMEKRKEKMDSPISTIGDSYYPQTIEFTAEQLPEVKKWEVGKEYEITIKTKMTSYEQRKNIHSDSKKEKEQGRFEIIAVKSEGKGLSGEQKKIMDFMKD